MPHITLSLTLLYPALVRIFIRETARQSSDPAILSDQSYVSSLDYYYLTG